MLGWFGMKPSECWLYTCLKEKQCSSPILHDEIYPYQWLLVVVVTPSINEWTYVYSELCKHSNDDLKVETPCYCLAVSFKRETVCWCYGKANYMLCCLHHYPIMNHIRSVLSSMLMQEKQILSLFMSCFVHTFPPVNQHGFGKPMNTHHLSMCRLFS